MMSMVVPVILLGVMVWGICCKVDVWSTLVEGGAQGLQTAVRMVPSLVGLLCGVYMLRTSGALELLEGLIAPVLELVGIPPETVGLLVVRPISGSAALGLGAELIETYGPDSLVGRTAAVMLGSTETTFYTVAVYFGAAKISRTRYAIPAALCGDVAGFLAASWAVRWLFGI